MTPETRAARERITAFATARSDDLWTGAAQPETLACIWQDGKPVKLLREDLRLVLAALDRHETVTGADHRAAQAVHEEWAAGRARD